MFQAAKSSSFMASKFTTATITDDIEGDAPQLKPAETSAEKAAKQQLFGKLTRSTVD
eukprot:Pgem_evm1s17266